MTTCYLCSSTDYNERKGAVRDDASLRILECAQCGLVALSAREHIQADHYADSGMHGDAVPSMQSWLSETEADDQRRFEMLKAALINRKVLDFGCGASGFVLKARAVAAEAAGVEPERRVRQYWSDKLRIYSSLEEAGDGYDIITAFHVVEHLPDPRAMLQELSNRLAPGGRLVVEVPSCDDALITLYDNDAFQRFTYWSQHLFLFNAETLRRVAVQAGVRVVSIQQFQRYPLSNHLHWLSEGKSGGHRHWSFIDTPELTAAYASSLAALGKCDTVVAFLEKQ